MSNVPHPDPSVLPPKNNHQSDRQENGSTQRMAAPFATENTIDGLGETSVRMADQTANGELDVAQSKAALGHISNAIATHKLKMSAIRYADKTRNLKLLELVADTLGGASGERFRVAVTAEHQQRQIAAERKDDTGGDKPNQS